jgi:hypothetical protein
MHGCHVMKRIFSEGEKMNTNDEIDVKPSVTLTCDFPNCKTIIPEAYASVHVAANDAIFRGWLVKSINGKVMHFCPDHKSQAPETAAEELLRLRKENEQLRANPPKTVSGSETPELPPAA